MLEYMAHLIAEKKKEVEDKIEELIEEFEDKVEKKELNKSQREEWMVKKLSPLLIRKKGEGGFFDDFQLMSTIYHEFAVEGLDKNQKSKKSEDIKAVYRSALHPSAYEIPEELKELMGALSLSKPAFNLKHLPKGSFAIQFEFKLKKPYISKDDEPLYIIDNPVRKERVFKVPMVSASSWKGALRSAVRVIREHDSWEDERSDALMARLFGNIKGEQEHRNIRAGRLYFYPTFFDKIGLEVINPHERKTGVGTQPIYIETVPAGATGTFSLLYVPLDCSDDSDKVIEEAKEDAPIVAEGIKKMLTELGFGAKTSSGFGVADIVSSKKKNNCVYTHFEKTLPEHLKRGSEKSKEYEEPDEAHLKYMDKDGTPLSILLDKNGNLIGLNEFSRIKRESREKWEFGGRKEYAEFKEWYEAHGSLSGTGEGKEGTQCPHSFGSFDEMTEIFEKVFGSGE